MDMATWVGPPRSWTKGRPRPIQYVVIHATAGSEGPMSAEAGAAYDKTRTDGTSTHIFVDSDSAVREVYDEDQAHAARYHGNAIGLQVEICGQANQTSAQWADAQSVPTLGRAAAEVAAMCARWDIPVRRLTVAECRAAWYAPAGQRPKGIVGHVDVTAAYPEDDGTHTDPGPGFPWVGFLQMVATEMALLTGKDDEMPVHLRVNETGACWISTGAHRYPLATLDDLNESLAAWGKTVKDLRPIPAARLSAHGADAAATPVYASPVTDAQLAELVAAAKVGAHEGVAETLNGATVTTVIHPATIS